MARNPNLTTDSRRTVCRRAALIANDAWQDWLRTEIPAESLLARRLALLDAHTREMFISENRPFQPDWRGDSPGLALRISALDAPLIDEGVRKEMERIVAQAMLKAMVVHKKAFLGALLRDQFHNDPPYYHVANEGFTRRMRRKVSRAATSLGIRSGY